MFIPQNPNDPWVLFKGETGPTNLETLQKTEGMIHVDLTIKTAENYWGWKMCKMNFLFLLSHFGELKEMFELYHFPPLYYIYIYTY